MTQNNWAIFASEFEGFEETLNQYYMQSDDLIMFKFTTAQ